MRKLWWLNQQNFHFSVFERRASCRAGYSSELSPMRRLSSRGWQAMGQGGKCSPRFRCKGEGQDYIFALPLFDSFTAYGQLKFVGNQRITRIKLLSWCLRRQFVTFCARVYSVSQKSSPLKLFAVFSLLVNLCNWNLPGLLSKHIPTSIPILVHLPEYLCEMYHFYQSDPQILRIQFSLVRNSWIFFVKTQVTSHDI